MWRTAGGNDEIQLTPTIQCTALAKVNLQYLEGSQGEKMI